ncbi:S-layer homology domain-containing protein [Halobacillus seohaensis]|uniref:S-layer homology domain-containing protein n=1 Tax=Halobacillus seohaensis TaxID=447421 RepID=A0ABW2EJI1_9BACI
MIRKFLVTILTGLLVLSVFTPQAMASSVSGSQITKIANKYSGTPYNYGGTTPSGFDCSGYTSYVFKQAGIDLPRTSSSQYGIGDYVSKSNLKSGDLVFFGSSPGSSSVSHVGIYTSNGNFISATSSKGVDERSVNDPYYWGDRYIGAKRIVEESTSTASSQNDEKLPTGQYHDVNSDFWAHKHIKKLSEAGIINGDNAQNFNPNNKVTRAEAAKMLGEAIGLKESTKSSFNDSSSHWAEGYINAAAEAGIIEGDGNGSFRPDDSISREEIAAILSRSFGLSVEKGEATFTDVSTDSWAYENIEAMVAHSITTGYDENNFAPKKNASRTEFAVFVYRALY